MTEFFLGQPPNILNATNIFFLSDNFHKQTKPDIFVSKF